MGNQLVWNDRYNIGVSIIDKEHRKLFRILNKLFDFGQQEKKSQWVCQEAVKYFKDHAFAHFQDEEDYMVSVEYEGFKMHKRIHDNFREITLPALEKELEQTDYSENAVDHFLGVCAGWLVGHTLTEDQAIVRGEIIKQWENLLPEEEQAVMGQAVISQLHNMFRLDSRLISNCYGGEKFGDGIYYRLIYSTKEKKRWEFFLVFEEQLLVNTIGSVMATKAKTVNVMLMNVARYTARQFVGHMKGHFPALAQADVKEEQLLTYDQFQKVFEKHSPQFSLLFDTGKGYFAYCMATGDMLTSENGASIITENAMAKLESYLNQNKAEKLAVSNKKKVLVVDDSDFMLVAMRQILGSDYEVLTATSGLSAFRSITLDRPDLILLDYEMPVCNGSQILEMIRSEKGFSDIPVIFLTSRVDKESVKKVLELKPQGYLSKSLSPELVKKEVDQFFLD
ncbi:response regulator [Lachnospiraceae bacterium]|nr:response regulator [Lachnospiraceae bacterium]